MITIAVVDDEKEQVDRIDGYLKRYFTENDGERYVSVKFRDGRELLSGYEPRFDIIFLDIEMNDTNGMEVAEALRKIDSKTVIIFITRLAGYAIRGYSVDALDFMVKPVEYEQFAVKLKRALKRVLANRDKQIKATVSGGEIRWINSAQIKYIEIQNHCLIIHLENEDIKTWSSLKNIAEQLDGCGFAYCNRCYLVNMRYVTGIVKNMCVIGDEKLLISRYKHNEFVSTLAGFFGRGGIIRDFFQSVFRSAIYSFAYNSDAVVLYALSQARKVLVALYSAVRFRDSRIYARLGLGQVRRRAQLHKLLGDSAVQRVLYSGAFGDMFAVL